MSDNFRKNWSAPPSSDDLKAEEAYYDHLENEADYQDED